jgi:hypothetical protein
MTNHIEFGDSFFPESAYGKFHDKLLCSTYFLETKDSCQTQTIGSWLSQIDLDSLNMMIEGFRKLAKGPQIDVNVLLNDLEYEEKAVCYLDFVTLVKIGYQWETGAKLTNPNLICEYFFRLAKLVQVEYAKRNNIPLTEEWQDKYEGKLSI